MRSPSNRTHEVDADVVVVRTGTTPGLRRDDDELVRALETLGYGVISIGTDYGLMGRLRFAFPFIDLIEAAALRHATLRVLQHKRADLVIFTTASSTLFQPAGVLNRSAVRFDATLAQNRPGVRNAITRKLGDRALRRASMLLPLSNEAGEEYHAADRMVVMPSPIAPGPGSSATREPAGLCYVGNPDKKGLDIAVAAWSSAMPSSWPLHITGISAAEGARFLRHRSVRPAENLIWSGRISATAHRKLSSQVEIYVGASRIDEFAGAQLEAIKDGALLVSVPSAGTITPLSLARDLAPELIATEVSAEALAIVLGRALALSDEDKSAYRERARIIMRPFSRTAFQDTLRNSVLPAFGCREPTQVPQ
jgi:hypothetical protein